MTRLAPRHNLNAETVESALAYEAHPNSPIVVDLRNCRFIRPGGLVVLALLLRGAHQRCIETNIHLTAGSDVATYLERMGIRPFFDAVNADCTALPAIHHHPAADRFLELTDFDSTGESVIDDVCRVLVARSSTWKVDQQRLNNSVFELGIDVEQHSGASGIVAVQHYPRQRQVEFAVGDLGRGIRASLGSAGFKFGSEVDAIVAAVETEASSRKAAEPWRGRGLPGLCDQVCQMDGSLLVRSGNTRVTWAAKRPLDVALSESRFPGTLAVGKFRTE